MNQKGLASNKTTLKVFAVGVALILNGMIYLICPDFLYNKFEFKQNFAALLSVLIALMLVNLYLNIKKK